MEQSKIDELARKERLAYFKAWRAANPDKVKKHNATYWKKRAEQKIKAQEANSETDANN